MCDVCCTADLKVTVITGRTQDTNEDDSGTDADVFITMFGDAGVCEHKLLDNIGVDDFEYGA